jgi:flagellar basal body-associated protein FliL
MASNSKASPAKIAILVVLVLAAAGVAVWQFTRSEPTPPPEVISKAEEIKAEAQKAAAPEVNNEPPPPPRQGRGPMSTP